MLAPAVALLVLLRQASGPQILRWDLPNGLPVLVEVDPRRERMELRAFFRGGRFAEPDALSGIASLLPAVLDGREFFHDGGQARLRGEARDEMFAFSLEIPPAEAEPALTFLAAALWETAILPSALEEARWKRAFGPSAEGGTGRPPGEFLHSLLRRSPYRRIAAGLTQAPSEVTVEQLQGFRRDYLHPRNGVLLVLGARDSEGWEERLTKTMGRFQPAFFSTSFSLPEELPHLDGPGEVSFWERHRVRISVVFGAPPRGSPSWIPFGILSRGLRERFGPGRVRTWAGIGSGLLWVEYETGVERFPEVSRNFLAEVGAAQREILASPLPPNPPLLRQVERTWNPDAAALELLWGPGPEAGERASWEATAVSEEQLRRIARTFLARSYCLVSWPVSRKDEWRGFP